MAPILTIVLGQSSAFNVRTTTRHVARMLGDEFDVHILTTTPSAFGTEFTVDATVVTPASGPGRRTEFTALRRYLADHDPDILTQIGDVPIYGTLISLLGPSETTFVCRYSGDLFTEYRLERGLRRAKLFALKNGLGRLPVYTADRFVTMGPREADRIVARGASPDDVTVLPPPIDPSRFADVDPAPFDVPDGRSVALFVGRVSRLKGAETLARTIPTLVARRPDLQFVLVGPVEADLSLPASVRDHVTFTGQVPPEVVPRYLSLADVYVHPSLTEGVSRSVLEAIASGTPVLARDVGDLASATSNLFTTDEEFVEQLGQFESLPTDSIDPFTVETLTPKYRRFFRTCTWASC